MKLHPCVTLVIFYAHATSRQWLRLWRGRAEQVSRATLPSFAEPVASLLPARAQHGPEKLHRGPVIMPKRALLLTDSPM